MICVCRLHLLLSSLLFLALCLVTGMIHFVTVNPTLHPCVLVSRPRDISMHTYHFKLSPRLEWVMSAALDRDYPGACQEGGDVDNRFGYLAYVSEQ